MKPRTEASQKTRPSVWESGWKAKEGGGGEEGQIRRPALIVHLGNSVRPPTEFLIGAVGCILIDTRQPMACFSSMRLKESICGEKIGCQV